MTDETMRAELSDLQNRLNVAVAEYDDAVARLPARDASNDWVMADVAMAHGHLFRFALVEIGALRAQLDTARKRLAALSDYDNTVAGKLRQQLNAAQAVADLEPGSLISIQDAVEKMP